MEEQKKKKHAFWLSPECKRKIEQLYQKDNCKSQSEFVENAVRFYAGYLGVKDASEYLAPVLSQVLHALDAGAESKAAEGRAVSGQRQCRTEGRGAPDRYFE